MWSAGSPVGRSSRSSARSRERSSTLPAWFVLIGVLVPAAQVQLYLANAKFTAGRIGILLLVIPALVRLFKKNRRSLLSDYSACAVAVCMTGSASYTSGAEAISSAGAESLEFLGGYIVARAFFFGPAAIYAFVR